MKKIFWANLLHIYQPPSWPKEIITKVALESYQPVVRILKKRPRAKITLNMAGSLTEQLIQKGFKNIIQDIKFLASRGQIEFIGSAKYHPLLPLIPKGETERQIKLNFKTNQKYFGKWYKTAGFFPPEMAFDFKLISHLKNLGFKWLAADEIGFRGKLGQVNFNQKYLVQKINFPIIFRNRCLSNFFFETPSPTLKNFFDAIKKDGRSRPYLITALDGENLGHHRKGMDKFFAKILDTPEMETLTYSELLNCFNSPKIISPLASSWSSLEEDMKKNIPFPLWDHPQNPLHRLQWLLTRLTINTVNKSQKDPGFIKAREMLDKSISSDQYWWASAHPWWEVDIVKKAAKNLVKALKLLKRISPLILKEAQTLSDQIINLVEKWQDSGLAKKTSEDFLQKVTEGRYFGGKKIIRPQG